MYVNIYIYVMKKSYRQFDIYFFTRNGSRVVLPARLLHNETCDMKEILPLLCIIIFHTHTHVD